MSNYAKRLAAMPEPKTTSKPHEVRYGWQHKRFTIPANTPVVPVTNLPDGGYWIVGQAAWPDEVYSWAESYGFHIAEDEL